MDRERQTENKNKVFIKIKVDSSELDELIDKLKEANSLADELAKKLKN